MQLEQHSKRAIDSVLTKKQTSDSRRIPRWGSNLYCESEAVTYIVNMEARYKMTVSYIVNMEALYDMINPL